MRLRYMLMAGATALFGLAVLACGTDVAPLESRVGAVEDRVAKLVPPPEVKQFYVTGVEWKGTTSADELAPPSVDPTTLSRGYGFKGPGILDLLCTAPEGATETARRCDFFRPYRAFRCWIYYPGLAPWATILSSLRDFCVSLRNPLSWPG